MYLAMQRTMTVAGNVARRTGNQTPRRMARSHVAETRALPVDRALLFLAEVGDVEAPPATLFVAAAIATLAVLLVPFGLKGGTDAASEMQERDAKSGRWRK